MGEKPVQTEGQTVKKERFEFIFTINGNIICQRYFRINGFKTRALNSVELTDTFNYCVSLIQKDLTNKSRLFLWYTAPQVFSNKEEMDKWVSQQPFKLEVPTYVVLKDSDQTYVWNGTEMELYEGYFNKADYVASGEQESPCVLKLAFLDSGREVISKSWDGNVYPRFVRTNIDLSNSKNKYDGTNGSVFAPFESSLIKILTANQPDLIPQIVKEICICCSSENDSDYTTSLDYGEKHYNLNVHGAWERYVGSLEAKYRKKTDQYLKTIDK